MSDPEDLTKEDLEKVISPTVGHGQAESSSGSATRFRELFAGQEKWMANKKNNLLLKEDNDDLEKEVERLRQLPVEKGPDGEDLVTRLPKPGPFYESAPLTSAGAVSFYKQEMIRRGILKNAERYECSLRKLPYDDAYV